MNKEKYKTITISNIIYSANNIGIWLWVEDDKLKFKFPKNINISEILVELKENKDAIIEVLQKNNIYTEKATESLIYCFLNGESMLSFAQERLWFIEQYEQGTNAYHMPSVFELDKSTDIDGLRYAL
ncbi:condensation domain-containing protein, partial [Flavobacterium sp. T12S277]|uniref:TubC N-terminal docking domain-related protein n=1 Tax=Flavobacterium sp. T12S277 TaxID=3402752 RepID=UPI003AEECB1D